jgi:ribonuclease HII
MSLQSFYKDDSVIEIGVDEVGRGPMFGRVYTAAVILPKNNSFKHELMKDSKKFTSWNKLITTANYIKENCIEYSISYEDEYSIDKNNILNATYIAMHKAIKNVIPKNNDYSNDYLILVDGNNFKPVTYFDNNTETIKIIDSVCIIDGDNKYTAIAAASILAKVERDLYIKELCETYPKLDEIYDLSNNKGYGTKRHMDGIKNNGITRWHRKTFGICKTATIIDIN